MYCLYRLQYKSKRVHVPKYTHFPTTGYARVLLFMIIRRELAEERYRMFISVYILCIGKYANINVCNFYVCSDKIILFRDNSTQFTK